VHDSVQQTVSAAEGNGRHVAHGYVDVDADFLGMETFHYRL
jgi:hypothetical protein